MLKICFWISFFLIGMRSSLYGQLVETLEPSMENCKIYKENSEWLPDAYIKNTTCACERTPNESKANLIRKELQVRLINTPNHIKEKAALMKKQYQTKKITKCAYNRFIKKELTPIIYADHVIAYSLAGCEANPAPYWAWKIVSTKNIGNCDNVWFAIRYFGGSCYNHFGKW